MPRATDDVHVRQPQAARRVTHRVHALAIEIQRREIGRGNQLMLQPMLGARRFDHRANLGDHRLQLLTLQVTKVQGHAHFTGNHVARPGIRLQATHRAAGMRLMAQGGTVDRLDHGSGAHQGILAQVHGCWPRMGLDAAQGQVEPLLAECPQYHADGLGLVFEDRPLLDMRLEIGPHRMPKHRPLPRVTNGIQGVADTHPLGITLGQGVFQGEFAGEYPRAHHARGKARAFLVGPHHHLQWRFGFHAQVIERADHLQPGHHSEAAVELAARGLGVDMAAGHHRWQRGVAPGPAGEDVADRIDTNAAPGRFAPGHEQVASLAVEVGQRQAADAALGGGAEAREVHQRLPQTRAVDVPFGGLQSLLSGGHGFLLRRFHCLCAGAPGCAPPGHQGRSTAPRRAASR
ncbi:hypothetical protein D3C81_911360 [compost metagenome]